MRFPRNRQIFRGQPDLGAYISVFFLLRECQHRLPPTEHASPAAAPASPEGAAPEPAPAPQ